MPWTFDGDAALPVLANGDYGLRMTPEDLDALRAHGTVGALERGLFDLAGRQRKPKVGRDALRAAFGADGRRQSDQLDEIWGLLHPPAGAADAQDDADADDA
jgi:hypothetical protein